MMPQMFAYGAVSGAVVIGLLWWAMSRRVPNPEIIRDRQSEDAERLRLSAIAHAEALELEAKNQRAAATMYGNRVKRLGKKS